MHEIIVDYNSTTMLSKTIYEVYMFVNRKKIFNIDSREEFSVIYYSSDNTNDLKIAVDIDDYKGFYSIYKHIAQLSLKWLI